MKSTRQGSLEHFLQWTVSLDLCISFIIESSTRPFWVVTLLFLRTTVDWRWRPFCCFSQECSSLSPLYLNPLSPQTKATSVMLRSQSESDNVKDSNSVLRLSTLQFCPMAWPYLVLYIHTSGLCDPNTLLNCPCQHSNISISEGFLYSVCVCVCVCTLLCVTFLSFLALQADTTNFSPVTNAQICQRDCDERKAFEYYAFRTITSL